MEDQKRCQSCGITLEVGLYGTEKDGSASDIYCKLCYEDGNFREPQLTLEDMIARTTSRIIDEQKTTKEEAISLAGRIIPGLKRWNTSKI